MDILNMNEVNLKACPFCGGKAKFHIAKVTSMATLQKAEIRCSNCLASTATLPLWPNDPNMAEPFLIEAWNRRA